MKKNKEKKEMNTSLLLIIGLIIIFVIVMNLQNINNLLSNKNNGEIEPVEEKIPTRYQCFYGPMVDEFYNYIESEYVVFDFDSEGNVSGVTSEEKYQATTLNDYNQMLNLLSIDSENVSYDKENYIVTVVNTSSNKFPNDYKSLNKYLSSNQYTCSKE